MKKDASTSFFKDLDIEIKTKRKKYEVLLEL